METKQIRNLVLLCVLLAVCVGGYFGLKGRKEAEERAETEAEAAEEEAIDLVQLEAEDIMKLSWIAEGETRTAEKRDDVWYSGSVSLNAATMTSCTADISNLSASRKITGDEVDQEAFGLSEPSNVITAETAAGEKTVITLGARNPVTSDYYAMVDGDTETAYLVGSALSADFGKLPEDMAE